MALVLPFIFGFSASFIGMMTPSMLNMTTAKIRLQRGRLNAIKFALGASLVILLQVYLAILFTEYLKENPGFFEVLEKFALGIFVLLSLYFFKEYKKENQNTKGYEKKCNDTFVVGLFLSALNMFAIPFYYGITTILNNFGIFKFSQNNILLFVVGSAIGSFILLILYSKYAYYFQSKLKRSSNYLNLVLSIITGILAVATFIKVI